MDLWMYWLLSTFTNCFISAGSTTVAPYRDDVDVTPSVNSTNATSDFIEERDDRFLVL